MQRLQRATNDHDLEALVACFSADYRNETPAHPERGFTGREQVRANWTQIFAAIPDVTCEVLRCAVDGDTVWSEWEHRGTRPDGTPHLMRGVVIFGVDDGLRDLGALLPRAGPRGCRHRRSGGPPPGLPGGPS